MKTLKKYLALILIMIAFPGASTLVAQERNEPEYKEMTELEYQILQQKMQQEITGHNPVVEVPYEPNSVTAAGDNCSDPIPITASPDMETWSDIGQTTCGRYNNYSETCMGDYDGGEDIIYELVVEEDMELKFTFQAYQSYSAIAIMDACGNEGNCIIFKATSGSCLKKEFYWSPTAGTYYIQVDTWPSPYCTNFDLTIEEHIPPPPAETITTFPYNEGFDDCTAWPVTMLPFAGLQTNAVLSVDAGAGGDGGCGALLEGKNFCGFYQTYQCGTAFDYNYPEHSAQIKMNYTPDATPGSLRLDFDFRQFYSFSYIYSWFRVVIVTPLGDTVTLTENSGTQCFNFSSTFGEWTQLIYDLSAYQTVGQNYELILDFVGKYYYLYFQGGDAVMVDNVHLWFVPPDNSPPVAVCQDVSVSADENCEGLVTAEMVDNGSSDPDGDPITLTLDPPGPYYPLGETTVTLTVTDDSGLEDDCEATITVTDVDPPVISCPEDIYANNDAGQCDAVVNFSVTATDNCDNDVTVVCVPPSGSIFPVGTTTVNCAATDDAGNTNTCSFNVVVSDIEAPVLTVVSTPLTLWPPNHKYESFVPGDFIVSVDDNCSAVGVDDVIITKVTSDEPEDANGNGDGHTLNDMVIADDCMSVQLRKEREGTGNGRVYTVYLELNDESDNTGTAICQVTVQHNIGETAIDDGPVYEVLGNCDDKSSAFADNDNEKIRLIVYPNPFNGTTTIEYELQQPSIILISIYNHLGLQVFKTRKSQPAGIHKEIWDDADLPSGVYYCMITTNNGRSIIKTIKY